MFFIIWLTAIYSSFGSGSPVGYGQHEDINYPLAPIFDCLLVSENCRTLAADF
jgi:hypothetical protein